MKFTLSWLKDHLETEASLEDITTRLTQIGLEVEHVTDSSAALKPFIVGEITHAEQHPDADRLRVCDVNTGSGMLKIVCGAPNARAGLKTALARPGDVIPSSGQVLKAGVIRGVESQGMMCSERELGLPETVDGIIELPETAQPGQPITNVLNVGDPVIEINLTPNRADCASVYGIARDLSATGIGSLKTLRKTTVPGSFDSPIGVGIEEAAKTDCPLFIGRAIKHVANKPSPAWLQDRLRAIGVKPISALVDVTNYFTFDLGRPLHVFDMDRLNGRLTIRHGYEGEKLQALNGKSYDIAPSHLIIADDSAPVSLAGVMGGEATGCSDDTTSVFVEVALFRPGIVAAMGRELGITSDARYRFERGVDPAFLYDAVELATKMIIDLCGGEASEIVVAGTEPHWRRELTLYADRVKNLGGVDVPVDRQMQILEALGFKFEGTTIIPPSWRADVEGEADLVEEILRIVGYDSIPAIPLPRSDGIARPAVNAAQKRQMLAKRLLASRGLSEAVTFSFTSSATLQHFEAQADSLKLLNPISADLDAMRTTIVCNLAQAAARNAARGQPDSALFEVGPIYRESGQEIVATMLRSGDAVPRSWAGAARGVGVFDVKADVLALLAALGVPDSVSIEPTAPAWYHPGRSGSVKLGHKVLATFGELHPRIAQALGCDSAVATAEVFFDALPEPKQKGTARPLLTLSPYQSVTRDFAFVVRNDVSAAAVIKAARAADKTLIATVDVFDIYSGKGVEDGHKSLAIGVTLQPADRTLTDAEIEQVAQAVIKAVTEATGAKLRG
jgi:phenylalanyl-tRNA synthetase beta chain